MVCPTDMTQAVSLGNLGWNLSCNDDDETAVTVFFDPVPEGGNDQLVLETTYYFDLIVDVGTIGT